MAKSVRWEVLNLGWLSRNRYWGESDETPMRGAMCVSTFVEIDGVRLVTDPSSTEIDQVLFNRTGVRAEQIDAVYVTHAHADHFIGLERFAQARLFCAPGEHAELLRQLKKGEMARAMFADPDALAARIEPAREEAIPGARLLALPGHTLGLAGLLFDTPEGTVAIAGDSVMTREFFLHRQGYFNSIDQEAVARSMDCLAACARWIVPGHGNYFAV